MAKIKKHQVRFSNENGVATAGVLVALSFTVVVLLSVFGLIIVNSSNNRRAIREIAAANAADAGAERILWKLNNAITSTPCLEVTLDPDYFVNTPESYQETIFTGAADYTYIAAIDSASCAVVSEGRTFSGATQLSERTVRFTATQDSGIDNAVHAGVGGFKSVGTTSVLTSEADDAGCPIPPTNPAEALCFLAGGGVKVFANGEIILGGDTTVGGNVSAADDCNNFFLRNGSDPCDLSGEGNGHNSLDAGSADITGMAYTRYNIDPGNNLQCDGSPLFPDVDCTPMNAGFVTECIDGAPPRVIGQPVEVACEYDQVFPRPLPKVPVKSQISDWTEPGKPGHRTIGVLNPNVVCADGGAGAPKHKVTDAPIPEIEFWGGENQPNYFDCDVEVKGIVNIGGPVHITGTLDVLSNATINLLATHGDEGFDENTLLFVNGRVKFSANWAATGHVHADGNHFIIVTSCYWNGVPVGGDCIANPPASKYTSSAWKPPAQNAISITGNGGTAAVGFYALHGRIDVTGTTETNFIIGERVETSGPTKIIFINPDLVASETWSADAYSISNISGF